MFEELCPVIPSEAPVKLHQKLGIKEMLEDLQFAPEEDRKRIIGQYQRYKDELAKIL